MTPSYKPIGFVTLHWRSSANDTVKFQDEAITVIFPSTLTPGAQVLLISQFTVTPDNAADKSFFARGVIKSSGTHTTIAFSLTHSSGSIDFVATRSDGDKELLLNLGQSIVTKHLTTLSLIYHAPVAINPKFYGGTLDLEVFLGGGRYRAAKETLVAISTQDLLGGERLLCVVWQWTEVQVASKSPKLSTARNTNVHFVSPSYDSGTLALMDRGFNFLLRREENHQTPHTLVIENLDTQAQSLVTLGLFPNYIEVYITNDTSYFVNCQASSDSSASENGYATGGVLFAALGIPMVLAPPHIGLPFACAGLMYSYAAFGWGIGYPDKGQYTGMPPQGSMTFRDYGNVNITVLRVKQVEQTILVQIATIEEVKEGSFKISQVEDKSWVDMVRLDSLVPVTKVLKTRGILRLQGVKPTINSVGKVIDETNSSEDMGIYYLDPVSSQVKYQDSFASKAPDGGQIILERNTDSWIDILFNGQSGENWSVERIGFGHGDLILVLRYVDIIWPDTVTEAEVLTSVGAVYNDFHASIAQAIAFDNAPRSVYYVKNSSKQLYGLGIDYTKAWQFKLLPRGDSNYENVYTVLRFRKQAILNAALVEK